MTRLERKYRTDIMYKSEGGLMDLFDNAIKSLWRINDEEYDYIYNNLTEDELLLIMPEFKSISEIKKAITIVNNTLIKKSITC